MASKQNREFLYIIILSLVQFCNVLDFVIMMPLAPVFMREFSISSEQFGLLVAAYNFSAAPMTLVASVFADRFNRKNFLLWIFVFFSISTFFCAISNSFYTLLIARVFAGAFGGILGATIFAVLADLISEERRGRATGAVMSSFSIASILGVPLGLAIAFKFSWQASFYFILILCCITFFMILAFIPSLDAHLKMSLAKESFFSQFKILKNKKNLLGIILLALISFSSFLLIPFISPYAVQNVKILETDLQQVYFFGGLITFISAQLIGRMCDKIGDFKTFLMVNLISFIPAIIFTNLTPIDLWLVICVTSFFTFSISGRFIPCMNMISKIPAPENRGVYMSFVTSFRSFFTGLASLVGGLIVYENAQGQLNNYNILGVMNVIGSTIAIFVALKVFQEIKKT